MNTINRNFGIELEIAGISMSQTVEALRNAGIRVEAEGYNHDTKAHWKVVTDASVRNGHEVVSPILRGEAGLAEAEKVARALESAGAKVNKTCGLHVHFEGRDLSVNEVRTIAQRYAEHETDIDAFMATSRRANNNTYCKSTKRIFLENPAFTNARTVLDLVHAQCGRYYKLNLQSYTRHHTIEFRQHQGTVSAEKIGNWVRFLNGFIDESRRIANGINGTAPEAATHLPNLHGAQARLAGLLAGDGQSADFLQGALHLLPHSLRAAISYLRKTGVTIESSRRNGQTIYRLAAAAATAAAHTADTLFAGIDADLQRFYRRRATAFAA